MAMSVNERLLEKAKSVSEPQFLQNMEEFHFSQQPAEMERQLEFLDFSNEGQMLLGCSNLTGRYWVGSIWYYTEPSDAPSVEKALTGLDCDNGVVEGFFVGNEGKTMLAALDNGSVDLVALRAGSDENAKSQNFLERVQSIQEHDDIITGLALTSDGLKVVTSSYDKSVVVLDLATLRLEQRKLDAHSDLISHVAANHLNPNSIATVGNDGKVLTWDVRNLEESPGCTHEDVSVWPTCVAWSPSSEHHLLVGNQSGSVMVFDVRRSNEPVVSNTNFTSKQIYRMKFSTLRPNLFAVSVDNVSLHVLDLDQQFTTLNVKYCDKRHDDFIRGLAWHPKSDILFTCGWDHKVYTHTF